MYFVEFMFGECLSSSVIVDTATRPALACASTSMKTVTCQTTMKSNSVELCSNVRWTVFISVFIELYIL
jgi:hypothetical protein